MTNYDPVLPIRNLNYFAKTASFYHGPCASALLHVYRWLYKRNGLPEHFIDQYDSFSKGTKKKFNFNKGELTKLKDIKKDHNKIKEFDVTLLYKLIQHGTGNDQLVSPNDNVWTENCPQADEDKLEHLLFLIKNRRNDVAHAEETLKNLSDNNVDDECKILIGRLFSIIQQSGEMASIDQSQRDEVKKGLQEDLERIRDQKEGQLPDRTQLLRYIKKDLGFFYKEDLKRSFENELRGYCPPNFVLKADQSECTTKNLLSTLNSQILIVNGESGMGKTSLTKYLFRCWLLDETEKLDLSCYEVTFRIDCRNICTSDISQFLEDEFPNAHCYLSNIGSLKDHLKQLKVLWIMDGFDESTPASMLFMKSLQKNLSSKHKIVITTRPDCLNKLKNELMKNATEVTLKNFTSDQVYEDAKKYLGDKIKFDEFNQFYTNLSYETKKLMETPGNLNLCLDLWSSNPDELDPDELSMHKLYEKISLMQVNQLVERHCVKTLILHKDRLKKRVEKWLYDVLCKVAAESFIVYFKFTISNDELERLKDEAMEFHLIENYCLSTFLNAEQSHGGGLRYVYRHRTQQEVLASLYLRKSDDDTILKILEGVTPCSWVNDHLENKINMLVKTCNGSDLVRISDLFLNQTRFMEYHWLIQDIWWLIFEDAKLDDEFGKAFRTKMSSWPKPFTYRTHLNDVMLSTLNRFIDCLLPDVSKLDIDIYIKYPEICIDEYKQERKEALRNLIEVFKTYKNKITFELTLNMRNLYPELLNILKQDDHHTLVKKITYEGPPNNDLNILFDIPNLKEINFDNNYIEYPYDNAIVSRLVLTCSGDPYLHPSCVAHFDLRLTNKFIERLSSFLSVSKMFREVSFKLRFFIENGYKGLPEDDCFHFNDVISKCISSLNIKVLSIILDSIILDSVQPNCILFRLVNALKLETVHFIDRSKSNNLDYEILFKLWNCSEQKNLKEVEFETHVKNLKMLYKHIPMNLIGITSVNINYFHEGRIVTKEDIPEYNGKKFKNITFSASWKKNWSDTLSPEANECVNLLRQFHLQKY